MWGTLCSHLITFELRTFLAYSKFAICFVLNAFLSNANLWKVLVLWVTSFHMHEVRTFKYSNKQVISRNDVYPQKNAVSTTQCVSILTIYWAQCSWSLMFYGPIKCIPTKVEVAIRRQSLTSFVTWLYFVTYKWNCEMDVLSHVEFKTTQEFNCYIVEVLLCGTSLWKGLFYVSLNA